jgi:hypothetical protein
MLGLVLLATLVVLLLGALPDWPYSRTWSYYPSGVIGFAFIIVVVLLLTGRI